MILKAGFVDLLGTMHADPETTPLVAHEYDEWGHPEENQEVMRQLCPMTNLPTDEDEMRHFPAVLATGGEHDRRVPFEMPLKYILKLRERSRKLLGSDERADAFLYLFEKGGSHFDNEGWAAARDVAFCLEQTK